MSEHKLRLGIDYNSAGVDPDEQSPSQGSILLMGLGNNGVEFDFTPHNIGHHIIDNIISQQWLDDGNTIIIKNNNFMNQAGISLKKYLMRSKALELVVICDDIDLELGLMRIRYTHSNGGGHNGLKSINAIWPNKYWLIKIGFCPDIEMDQNNYQLRRHNSAKYVLKKFKYNQKLQYELMVANASREISAMIKEDHLYNQTIDLLGADKCL